MNSTISVLAILAVSPFLRAQNVGLELECGTPVLQAAGSVCMPVSCTVGPQQTLHVPLGANVSALVFGAPQQIFLLGIGGPLACQAIPGIHNDLALGGIAAVVGGVLPPVATFCAGSVSAASIQGIHVPATLPAGSQFLFQALTVESGTLQLAFTTPVLLIAG
jgi:hypothetical protein